LSSNQQKAHEEFTIKGTSPYNQRCERVDGGIIMASEGKWPSAWERTESSIHGMDVARIPVHTTKDGERVVVDYYTCPIPSDEDQFDAFKDWAGDRLGDASALDAFVSGVQVKIAGQIRTGATDPERAKNRASQAFAKLTPEAREELLAELAQSVSA
jgi:hypothetical protein